MDVITSPRRERADAARNRVKILTAAEIVATHGVEGLPMTEVAEAARCPGVCRAFAEREPTPSA
ncbi:hypothetical protein [Streptosporangium roseum]|uniref:hypothetical protein n=1 Tax=Streptosporangium roseum TaxID=2001 RepID=UPI003333A3DD